MDPLSSRPRRWTPVGSKPRCHDAPRRLRELRKSGIVGVGFRQFSNLIEMTVARIDHITGGIYRISIWSPEAGLTFNQFLIDDEAPTLVHTGRYDDYDAVVGAIAEVVDPARLANIVLLHWEGDENGGMDRLMSLAGDSQLVGSALSIALNASGFGFHNRTRGFRDGERSTSAKTSSASWRPRMSTTGTR